MTLNESTNLFRNKGKSIPCFKKYPTGFNKLDELLGGGFSAGLHCIGATPSLGKSTFVLQIAEHFAEQGKKVMFFSLEMSELNIAAKSISRELFKSNTQNASLCKSADELINREKTKNYSDAEWETIEKASLTLNPRNSLITIIECEKEPCTVSFIENTLKSKEISPDEDNPIVIIDYLQILAPDKQGLSDKQSIDRNLEKLRYLAKTYNMTILVISSFNRENYDVGVSLKSFKDSGNIEYSCDTIIGMQYTGTGEPKFNADTERKRTPRKIDIVILKQRNGRSGYSIKYRFYPKNNFFEEIQDTEKEYIAKTPKSNDFDY